MKESLKILLLEDSPDDAEIIRRFLAKKKLHFEFSLAVDKAAYLAGLDQFHPDIILSDHSLSHFNSADALAIARERFPDIPFILVTGIVSEEFAADIIKAGADDYIFKDRLTRLPAAIDKALRLRQTENGKLKAAEKLRHSEENYRAIMERVSDGFLALDKDGYCIYANKKAGEIIRCKYAELIGQQITRAMIKAQEKERNYLGRELHDNINQLLASTKLYLEAAGDKSEEIKELIRLPVELINNSIDEIRLLSSNLVTPLKNIDLEDLVRKLLSKLDQNTMIKTDFTYSVSHGFLPDDLKLNIYRILQEQLNNMVKHAAAKKVSISIQAVNSFISVVVSDDGKGFDVNKKRKGIGISNMINRIESFNGEVIIESSPGKGCRITIKAPY